MDLVLKLTSFVIWFLIMLFIVGAAIRHKRNPFGSSGLHPQSHLKSRSRTKSDHQQSG